MAEMIILKLQFDAIEGYIGSAWMSLTRSKTDELSFIK